ncbi:MAG: ketoacyl-ACP synthase III [Bryobacterales bacterium]|nr:ketoacyl-ACP synthase III [Bryobacterales bacterium]
MAYIVNFGAALPARVVTNEELSGLVGRTADWIRKVSGIEERRYVDADTTVADLAWEAASDCLARAGMKASELGLILVSSGTPARQFPGPASQVARRLGQDETPAVDIPIASAGGLFAMAMAGDMANRRGPVLVVAAEVMSRIAMREPLEAGISVLFGDGAGACLVHPSEGKARILGSRMATDGAFAEDLRLEFGAGLAMNGRSVILHASRKLPRVILQVLEEQGVTARDVDVYLMHQANQNLMDRVADAIGVERGRFYTNIARYANTSSASMLIAAAEWEKEAGFAPGHKICFTAFGAGYHWGAMLAEGCGGEVLAAGGR